MMADIEEPPAKVIKMEVAPSALDSSMEGQEGQEEWLSEGVLTDDDYLPGNVSQDQDQMAINISEALNATEPIDDEPEPQTTIKTEHLVKMEQNIEEVLNDLQKTGPDGDVFDELLKKHEKASGGEQSDRHSDDDGHDTDDLLRMLGEDGGKAKKKVLTSMRDKKTMRPTEQSSDDDDYLFQGAKVTKLKVAKNAVIRKQATRAEPERFSDRDSDMSEDDVSIVKRMFGTKARQSVGAGTASASRIFNNNYTDKATPKQYRNKSLFKAQAQAQAQAKMERDEIIDEAEFLDDDTFDLDEDVGEDSSIASGGGGQLLRRPERMDEEVPSDEESHSDDSLYDGLPSSDSEDMDDWFTLDIRAERAGDYLPWLGEKAHKLLTEEKHRVSARLTALKHSVTALKSSERVQNDQIKVATEALHELEAMLAAA